MSRMYGINVGKKKPWKFFTIPTVGRSDISLQWPTSTITTIANQGCRRQKWHSSTPDDALRSMPMHRMNGQQPPKQGDIIFGAFEGVYGPQNTLMLWWFIIAGTKEHFGPYTPSTPPKIHLLAWGVVAHPFMATAQSARRHVGH
jgi:hypothetical protein